ncbi:OapC/ArvC family zinc-ribbon domain-containing protein [Halorussus salinus]|uniref:OapC/ArvC family zinc-ribbon domain-containing protein n=1 Tax=Halorussus salinus TaxID=1364935 RepID=UPI001092A4EC|nr:Zn-ribbon containing protein [Halorussus salinus]
MPHQCTNCGRTFEDGSKEMLSGCPDCGGNKFQFQPASAAAGNAGDGVGAGATPATEPRKTPENVGAARDAPETGGRAGTRKRGDPGDRGDANSERAREDDSATEASSGAVDRAAATVRDWVSTRNDADTAARDGAPGREDTPTRENTSAPERAPDSESDRSGSARNGSVPTDPSNEDSAQASARSDIVSDSELPDDPPEDAAQVGPAPADADDDANVVSAPDDDNPGLKELREELNSQFESIRIVNPGQYELNLMELYEREEYIISLQEDGKYVIEVPDAWDAAER